MRLTKRLLDFLHSVFDKAPGAVLALRIGYDGDMAWKVDDAVLTTEVVGGSGTALRIDLRGFNMQQLATVIATQPGYDVLYLNTDMLSTGARALLDGSGSPQVSNGDHFYAHTSVLWSYLEAMAVELQEAQRQIVEMLKQMSTRTAEDVWLDELGRFYGVPRFAEGEPDSAYGPRIIAEVLRPRGNNIAIALAIKAFTGQDSEVIDVSAFGPVLPRHDGEQTHNALIYYNSRARPRYGLFDVTYGYDLINGGDYQQFEDRVRALVDRVRDAGTHMRALILRAGGLEDVFTPPSDEKLVSQLTVSIEDTAPEPTESLVIPRVGIAFNDVNAIGDASDGSDVEYQFLHTYSGLRRHNARIRHQGGTYYQHATLESDLAGTAFGDHLHWIVNVQLPQSGFAA